MVKFIATVTAVFQVVKSATPKKINIDTLNSYMWSWIHHFQTIMLGLHGITMSVLGGVVYSSNLGNDVIFEVTFQNLKDRLQMPWFHWP